MKNDGVDIGGRENGLQGKTPCGFFFVGHTLEMTGVVHRCFFRIFLALICMKYFVQ